MDILYEAVIGSERHLVERDFLAQLSHQLLSYAAKVQALSDLLGKGYRSPEQIPPELFQILPLLVRDLEVLGYKALHIDNPAPVATHLPVNLAKLIDETIEIFSLRARDRSLIKTCPSDLPNICGNAEQIKIVLDNLLSNAFKYSPPKTSIIIAAEIYRGLTERCSGQIIISVTNLGSFIREDEQALIFNKFYRGKEVDQPGHGLGLYLSRRLVEMHGGQLEVESSPAEGTTFWFTLPVIGN
jgi:two-component system, OmpR family, phosphate regulon sensor histidine kinase PhoR